LYWIAAKVQQTKDQTNYPSSSLATTRDMETMRRMKRIGGSVVLPIPPEMLEEPRLESGTEVGVNSEGGSMHVRRAIEGPLDAPIQLAHRFAKRYETALRNLAQR
jgi:antitoxin component of MazEF toxin-antitoxin module